MFRVWFVTGCSGERPVERGKCVQNSCHGNSCYGTTCICTTYPVYITPRWCQSGNVSLFYITARNKFVKVQHRVCHCRIKFWHLPRHKKMELALNLKVCLAWNVFHRWYCCRNLSNERLWASGLLLMIPSWTTNLLVRGGRVTQLWSKEGKWSAHCRGPHLNVVHTVTAVFGFAFNSK